MLIRHDFGVLIFDRSGEGQSQGDFNQLGWDGEPGLRAAINYLLHRPDARPRPHRRPRPLRRRRDAHTSRRPRPNLRAIVAEGASERSLYGQFHLPGLLRWEWLRQVAITTAAAALLSNHLPPPDLTDLVRRITPRAVFFIYAKHGQPSEPINQTCYKLAGQPKAIWEIPNGGHTGGLSVQPHQYESRVIAFFNDVLRQRR